ncbi:hypothetical protein PGTUg99_005714 [Puccinia graminis f. sp. tritici]|uniref:Uncharacterized protein n=1 Tax=Puccinia graminis f. sp. tritici TaxID=56615 RepID=A0A5B0QGL0_PUCGR|nr:hypothetical protein PGTUg99_013249 [Puccinia graminis f. sp. tritici]KAA1112357.1 hypothetical protein PGTUg99_005714 [Puccinia graminis f. sp. tritici]
MEAQPTPAWQPAGVRTHPEASAARSEPVPGDYRPPFRNDPLVFSDPPEFHHQNFNYPHQNCDSLHQYFPPDEDMTVDNNPQFAFQSEDCDAMEDSPIPNNHSFGQGCPRQKQDFAVDNGKLPVDAAGKEEALSRILSSFHHTDDSFGQEPPDESQNSSVDDQECFVENNEPFVNNQECFVENNEPFVYDQECPDGNEYPLVDDQDDPDESKNSSVDEQECFMGNDKPCVNDQACPDGNERSSVDDQDDLVYSAENESSLSEEASRDEGSDFDHLADENSEDNDSTELQGSESHLMEESTNPSQSLGGLVDSKGSGQSEIITDQAEVHENHDQQSATITCSWTPDVLRKHDIAFKSKDNKQTLVDHYEQLMSSQAQAVSEIQHTQLVELPPTAPNHLPTNSTPSCAPKPPQDLPPAVESTFDQFSPEELREMLDPFPLKTSSLSKKALVLLCEAHVNIDQPMQLRRGSRHSGTDATSDPGGQIPMEIDSCNSDMEESHPTREIETCNSDMEDSHPTTAYNPPQLDLENGSLNSVSISSPPQNSDSTFQTQDIPQYFKALVDSQAKTNQLLAVQISNSERFNQAVLSRLDNLTPRMDQIIESAATNSGNGHIPSTSSGLRTATTRENVQATPSGGRFAVSPSIIEDSECISRTEVELLLKELIRIHVATLLGLRPREPIPPPATEAERAQWISQPDENIDDRADDNNPSDTDMSDLNALILMARDMPTPLLKHSNSSKEKWIVLGYRHFYRTSPNRGINLQMYGCPTITSRMKHHVKDTWQRTYRKNQPDIRTATSPKSLAKRTRMTTRVIKLRRVRCNAIVHIPELKGLLPIIEQCCSEDESDQSDAMSIDSDTSSSECESDVMDIDNSATPGRCSSTSTSRKAVFNNANPKRSVVRKFIWRNPAVDDLMILLDEWRLQKSQSTPKKRTGPIPTIRKRPTFPLISYTKPSPCLPYDVYDPEWLSALPDVEKSDLDARPEPAVQFYASILHKYRQRQR